MYGTARTTGYGYSLFEFSVYGGSGGGTPPPPTGGSLGSNVIVFSPSMAQSSIQSQLNAISNQQVPSEFGTGRYELLFQPGTYGSAASPLIFTVGFYEAVAGLGRNPGDVVINGTVDSYNQCSGSTCNATTNFWRSLTNLTINVMGMSGCQNGDDFWAVSQAAPMRRVHVNVFRVGGATAGSVTTPLVDNSNNSLLDDVWIWRADHGAGAGTWTGDQSPTGLVVTGGNVTAYGLAVEHFQKNEVDWNGQNGTVVFFQNENPYEVPSQAAWMSSASQKGYPALYIPNSVSSFQGYGLGSYSYFNQGVDIHNAMAFQVPQTAGVQLHDILTVFLNGSGGIDTVVNGIGKPVSSAFGGPSDVVSYP